MSTPGTTTRAIALDRSYDPTTGVFLSPDPLDENPGGSEQGTPTEGAPYHYVDNDPLNGTDPLGLCRMKDGDYVFDHLANICDNARAHATSTAGCGGDDWDGLAFYEWDPFTTIEWRGGHGCSVTLRDGTTYGAWWDVAEHLCLHLPGSDDDCRSVKAAHPGFYQGLVVVAVVAGVVAVIAAGPEIAAYCAATSAVCFSVINGGGGGAVAIDQANAGHIFRNAQGHIATDTPAARQLLQSAVQPQNLISTNSIGVSTYRVLLPNGTQVWAEVFNGQITNGGINLTPR